MTNHEQLPDIDPAMHELMAHTSLLLNVRSAIASAHRRNAAIKESEREDHRPAARRFVMLDVPDPAKPPRLQAFDHPSQRVLMTPVTPKRRPNLLVIRTPAEETFAKYGDHLLELITRTRKRYLLKESGLWLYRSAADLSFEEGVGFVAQQTGSLQPADEIQTLNHVFATHDLEQQTNADIDL